MKGIEDDTGKWENVHAHGTGCIIVKMTVLKDSYD